MVVTGRSRKAFAGNRTWVRIPPFPPISEIDLLLEVYFAIAKVGFERRTFPERIARKKKCEAGRFDNHLFRHNKKWAQSARFFIMKVGFECRAFPERTARKKKCEAGRLDNHLFRSSGGIRRQAFP